MWIPQLRIKFTTLVIDSSKVFNFLSDHKGYFGWAVMTDVLWQLGIETLCPLVCRVSYFYLVIISNLIK